MTGIENTLTRILETIVTAFFGVIILLTILLVVMRYVFNSSIIGGNELMEYLFIYTTALGAAVAIGQRDHISITYVLDKMREPFRTAVDILGLVLVAGINILIAVLSRHWIAKVGSAESPVMRIPMWSVQISVPLGCVFAGVYCIIVIIGEIRKLRDGGNAE
jgi:TRAP-type transport system small permease protein